MSLKAETVIVASKRSKLSVFHPVFCNQTGRDGTGGTCRKHTTRCLRKQKPPPHRPRPSTPLWVCCCVIRAAISHASSRWLRISARRRLQVAAQEAAHARRARGGGGVGGATCANRQNVDVKLCPLLPSPPCGNYSTMYERGDVRLCDAVRPPSRRPSFVSAKFFIPAVINDKQSVLVCSGGAQGQQGETRETKGLTFTGRRGQTGNEEL